MNKRIKELAQEAGIKYGSAVDHFYSPATDGITRQDMTKFAQLIIRDIGQIVSGLIVPETFEQDIGPYEYWNRALGTLAIEIEQHFYGEE
jgi:hypothetical protein